MSQKYSKDMRLRIVEAEKDSQWLNRVKNAKTAEEYTKLLEEKGIFLPEEYKQELSSIKFHSEIETLNDTELEQVVGGYFPIFDECLQRYDKRICTIGISIFLPGGCVNCRYVGNETEKDGTEWELYSCLKGYFKNERVYPVYW
ncbi:hypothetical protein [Petroclostridium sp. X23]|jgi:bacteriocin-like protein|uniref:hypothetical protein n=1 Tax=Petroclostridium sp. X23 TaxID=3045146 RepID=UPI0024ADA74D|nr:hypothetical protein [Petroclostridium sp. X23]WHH60800.1 hypothetical protein QKW49_08915 [Petroclostridium sp. X23]